MAQQFLPPRYHTLFYAICYYSVWFSCVLSAAKPYEWFGVLMAVGIFLCQVIFLTRRIHQPGFWFEVGILMTLGVLVDSVLIRGGWVTFSGTAIFTGLCPLWLMGIWLNFALFFSVYLATFYRYRFWMAGICFFLFPLSYWSGARLGAARFPEMWHSVLLIGIIWAVLFPLATTCCYLCRQ